MPRPARIALVCAVVLAFLAVSLLLARFLSTENVERDAVYGVLRAEARGDAAAMLRDLSGCGVQPACRAQAEANAAALRTPGEVKILAYESHTAYSLTGDMGRTRVAWKAPGRLPVVQCVLVRRRGDPLSGLSVTLISISAPIPGTSAC